MDIRQLRLFCRIVDRKSFSLAADEMHITQPAASQQVRSLERELKTILLDRSRRTVVPTDAGQVLYRYGREILDLDERARIEILDLGELVAGRIVVGASTGPGEHVLPGMLTDFKREFPGVNIALHVDDTHAVIERVLSREFEIGAVGAVTRARNSSPSPWPATRSSSSAPRPTRGRIATRSPSTTSSRSHSSCNSRAPACASWWRTTSAAPASAPSGSTS